MKFFFICALLILPLFANDDETFFNASKENTLLCRSGYESYVMISQKNAAIQIINDIKYFHYKNGDYYFPLAACKAVRKHDKGIIF